MPQVWEALTQALAHRQRIELTYLSPRRPAATPHQHIVEPYERYFDPVQGHYYLHGWCLYTLEATNQLPRRHYIEYRVGRILHARLLPEKLPLNPPPAPHYAVDYELAPEVARHGITRQPRIEILAIERRDDGSALVHGQTTDLFWAVETLLHYGATCHILGGPEVLERMCAVVSRMSAIYDAKG